MKNRTGPDFQALHTHQTGCFGLSAREVGKTGWLYLPVGPTNVVTHEIGRLVDVASGGTGGDGDGGEKKGWEQIEMH